MKSIGWAIQYYSVFNIFQSLTEVEEASITHISIVFDARLSSCFLLHEASSTDISDLPKQTMLEEKTQDARAEAKQPSIQLFELQKSQS